MGTVSAFSEMGQKCGWESVETLVLERRQVQNVAAESQDVAQKGGCLGTIYGTAGRGIVQIVGPHGLFDENAEYFNALVDGGVPQGLLRYMRLQFALW